MSPCGLSHLIDRLRFATLFGMEMVMQRTGQASVTALAPIMGAVFISFLIIGVAMPVLPLHVHQGLGLGTFIVGLVAGSQFAASLVSRVWAGRNARTSDLLVCYGSRRYENPFLDPRLAVADRSIDGSRPKQSRR